MDTRRPTVTDAPKDIRMRAHRSGWVGGRAELVLGPGGAPHGRPTAHHRGRTKTGLAGSRSPPANCRGPSYPLSNPAARAPQRSPEETGLSTLHPQAHAHGPRPKLKVGANPGSCRGATSGQTVTPACTTGCAHPREGPDERVRQTNPRWGPKPHPVPPRPPRKPHADGTAGRREGHGRSRGYPGHLPPSGPDGRDRQARCGRQRARANCPADPGGQDPRGSEQEAHRGPRP